MKINLLMFYQDDPKKCTAAKLLKFGLAKKITKSKSNTVLLHPYSKKTLFNHEKSLFTSITGIDCSWTLAEQVFQKDFVGISRKLPPLLAGNPVNYSKINKLTTVEAIAGAAFILGDEILSKTLLEKFSWGHTFLELNENLLHDYQNANSEDEVIEIIRTYGYHYTE
jgi:pre-rRNA-processing protein TSR3